MLFLVCESKLVSGGIHMLMDRSMRATQLNSTKVCKFGALFWNSLVIRVGFGTIE